MLDIGINLSTFLLSNLNLDFWVYPHNFSLLTYIKALSHCNINALNS